MSDTASDAGSEKELDLSNVSLDDACGSSPPTADSAILPANKLTI